MHPCARLRACKIAEMEIILPHPHRHAVFCRHVLQGKKDFSFSLLEELDSK
jgi:hypothetical protein